MNNVLKVIVYTLLKKAILILKYKMIKKIKNSMKLSKKCRIISILSDVFKTLQKMI